jgi:predicted aconitase
MTPRHATPREPDVNYNTLVSQYASLDKLSTRHQVVMDGALLSSGCPHSVLLEVKRLAQEDAQKQEQNHAKQVMDAREYYTKITAIAVRALNSIHRSSV